MATGKPFDAMAKKRFRQREEDEALPRFLDKTVLSVPVLALDALAQELDRHALLCKGVVLGVSAGNSVDKLASAQRVVQQLSASVDAFAERLSQLALLHESSERLAHLLRVHRYQASSVRLAIGAAPLRDGEPSNIDACYEPLKSALLTLGATGRLPLAHMEVALAQYSDLRKAAQQAAKAQAANHTD